MYVQLIWMLHHLQKNYEWLFLKCNEKIHCCTLLLLLSKDSRSIYIFLSGSSILGKAIWKSPYDLIRQRVTPTFPYLSSASEFCALCHFVLSTGSCHTLQLLLWPEHRSCSSSSQSIFPEKPVFIPCSTPILWAITSLYVIPHIVPSQQLHRGI